MSTKPPPLPPGFVLDGQSKNAPPPLPPGFVLEGEGESWSPNDPQPRQTVDPRTIPTKGEIGPYDPGMAGEVGNQLYDAARAVGLPASRMRRDAQGVDAFMRGAADVPTFGFADEIAAGAASATGVGGQQGNYEGNLKLQRAVDERDKQVNPVARMAGQLAGGVAGASTLAANGLSFAANAARGTGWLAKLLGPGAGRVVGGGLDGMLQAGGYGFGSGENIKDRVERAAYNAPLGGALGGAAEGLAGLIGYGLNSFARGASDVAPGVNPAQAVRTAQEFGIPLSRAQATQSVKQAGIEDQLRSQGRMQGFDTAQRGAIDDSVNAFQRRFAGERQPIPGPASAYDDLPDALRGVRDRTKAEAQQGYDASVNNPDVLVDGKAVSELPNFIRKNLDADQIVIDPMYHQGASRALQFIDDYISRMPQAGRDGVEAVQAQLRWVENLRASLGKNFPPIGQDAPALKAIKGALDDWTSEIFDRGLVSASDDVLDALKAGRAKWSEYRSMTEPRSKIGGRLNPHYEAQAAVRRIMDKEMGPEEIGRYLWGTSVAAPKQNSVMTAQLLKQTLGADSPQWNGIRQSFWLRATRANDETMSPARIAKNLDGMLGGDGASVAKALFSETEVQAMRDFAGTMRMLTPAKAGINNSNTANKMLPQLQRYASQIMGALAGGGSLYHGLDPWSSAGIAAVTGGASKALGALSQTAWTRAATSMPVPAMPSGQGGAALRGTLPAPIDEWNRRRMLTASPNPVELLPVPKWAMPR